MGGLSAAYCMTCALYCLSGRAAAVLDVAMLDVVVFNLLYICMCIKRQSEIWHHRPLLFAHTVKAFALAIADFRASVHLCA